MPTALAAKLLFACGTERGRSPNPALKSLKSSFQLLQVHCIYGTSKVLTFAKLRKNLSQTPTIQQNNRQLFRLSGKLVGASMRSKDLAIAAGGCCCRPVRPVSPDFSGFLGLSGKLVGTSMRSKDLAKASGLAVVFDLTAHTFYRVSPNVTSIQGRWPCCGLRPHRPHLLSAEPLFIGRSGR